MPSPLFGVRNRKAILNWERAGGLRGWMADPLKRLRRARRRHSRKGRSISLLCPTEGLVYDIDTRDDLAAARES
jgi:hypothetical protein